MNKKYTRLFSLLFLAVFAVSLLFQMTTPPAYAVTPTLTTVDSTGITGYQSAIAMGLDGFPRITYWDVTNDDLKFVQCKEATCSPTHPTDPAVITPIETANSTGKHSSIAIGSDGFAHISFFRETGGDLIYVHCTNAPCTSKTTMVVDTVGFVGYSTSIAVGSDGFARIAYFDNTNSTVKFVQCKEATCNPAHISSPAAITTIDGALRSGSSSYIDLVLTGADLPRISYAGVSNSGVKYARCTAVDCVATATVLTTVDATYPGYYNSLALGSDGFARISYLDTNDGNLRFVRCTDIDCITKNTEIVDSQDDVGYYNSLALGSDGFARISYYDGTNTALKFAACTDVLCTDSTIVVLDNTGAVGEMTSLVLNGSDFPRVSYYDSTNSALKVALCGDQTCDAPVPSPATPATYRSDTLSRQAISSLSNHTIAFTTSGGVAAGETMTVTFPAGFSIAGALDFTDVDVSYGPTTGLENELTLGASAAGATWGAAVSGQVLTITSGSGTIPASSRVVIEIGTNATTGATGDQQITNPSSADAYLVALGGTFNENGSIAVPITQADQVTSTAIVGPSITFDIDAATSDSNTDGPHTVALGTLSSSTLSTSRTDGSGTINALFFDLTTNAVSGATVSMVGANTGLSSVLGSTTITLPSNEATIAAGQERMGVCLSSLAASAGSLAAAADYDANGTSNCTSTNTGTPIVGKIQTTATPLFTSANAPVSGGRAALLFKASITSLTPAQNDYTNTITFIAIGTF